MLARTALVWWPLSTLLAGAAAWLVVGRSGSDILAVTLEMLIAGVAGFGIARWWQAHRR
jgi:hypothetical protein